MLRVAAMPLLYAAVALLFSIIFFAAAYYYAVSLSFSLFAMTLIRHADMLTICFSLSLFFHRCRHVRFLVC